MSDRFSASSIHYLYAWKRCCVPRCFAVIRMLSVPLPAGPCCKIQPLGLIATSLKRLSHDFCALRTPFGSEYNISLNFRQMYDISPNSTLLMGYFQACKGAEIIIGNKHTNRQRYLFSVLNVASCLLL